MKLPLGLALVALLVLGALPAAAFHQGHRHWSTIADGPYAVLPGEARTFLASDGTEISYAVHMPAVPPGTRVPVILSAGPYFGYSEEPVDVPSTSRYTGFLVDNFVSHGYAVVAASVRGTGLSGGCMELMSLREAQDMSELVTFLAQEPWSNGAVAMTGKSYDGGTPWAVARLGNPHLKTIVPLQGVTDQGALLFQGGAAQFRAPIFHSVVYWPFGLDVDTSTSPVGGYRPLEKRAENLACPELVEGQAAALYSTYTGETTGVPVIEDYWAERAFRDDVIEGYDGSVFIVHSLRDWNVLPSQVVPFFSELPQTKKLLLGQWAHQYPDEGVFTNRADFAAMLKAWFDRELKAMDVPLGPVAQVADGQTGAWRALDTWPPTNATARSWALSAGDRLVDGSPQPFAKLVVADPYAVSFASCNGGATVALFRNAPLPAAFRASGVGEAMLRFEAPVNGAVTVGVCSGSKLVTFGSTHVARELADATPGAPFEVRVALEPLEQTFPANGSLRVFVALEGSADAMQPYWPGTGATAGVRTGGELTLPVG